MVFRNIIRLFIQILLPLEIHNSWEGKVSLILNGQMIKLNIVTCMDWTKFSPFNFVFNTNSISIFYETILRRFFFGRCCRGEGLHNSEGGLERINQTWATTPSLHPSLLLLFGWHQKHKNTEFIQQGDKKTGSNCSTESQISTANPGSNIEVVQLKPLVNLHVWYQQIILNRYV